MAVNLGWAAGPALGGGIAEVSYQAMFVISAGVFLACAFFLRLALDADEAQRPGEGFSARALIDPASDRRFLAFTLCVLALASVMAQLVAPLSMHASLHGGLSESRIGLLFSLNGLLVVACQWPAARLIGRLRLSSALVLGCALYALGYGSVGFARGLPAFALCVLVFTLGEVMASPALQALSANLAPAGRKGRYMGFCGLMEQVGMAAGPLLGGLLQQWLGRSCPAAPWLCVAGAALAAGAGFSALGGRLSLGEQGLSEMPSEREFIAAGAGADGA
jgi:MFS family permease